MTADLHCHSHYSDGTPSPAEVVRLARARGLTAIALTDHDTFEGVGEALEAGLSQTVRVIPASEVTAQFKDQELHILAYFPEKAAWKTGPLQEKLAVARQIRLDRARKMVARLNKLGVTIELDDVLKISGKGSVGRPHIARALLARGQVQSYDEAFIRFLNRGSSAWVDKPRLASEEAIQLIHASGGLAVLAHPGLLRDGQIPAVLENQGIDGVEVYHTKHDARLSKRFLEWTRKRGLLATAGSDCHGQPRQNPLLGSVRLDGVLLENFLSRLG